MKLLILTLFVFFIKVYGGENKLLPCNCRLDNFKRIVGGETSKNHSIPWMVSLKDPGEDNFCSGSIVNEKYIITAASCFYTRETQNITIRLGLQNLLNVDMKNIYKIKNITTETGNGDLAIIELDRPIVFEPGKIEPACLNLKDDNFEDDLLTAGWGSIEKSWWFLDEGMNETKTTPNKDGYLRYFFSTQAETCFNSEICTIPKTKGASFCNGDGGGPLMHDKDGKTYVIGINSKPGFIEKNEKFILCEGIAEHTRLKKYKDFIKTNLKNYCKF